MPLSEINEAEAQKTIRDAEARMADITASYFAEKTGADVTGPPEVTGEEETQVDPPEKKEEPPVEKKEEETAALETETTKEDEGETAAEKTESVTEPVAGATTTADDEADDEEIKAIDSVSLGKNAHPKSQKVLKFLQNKAKEAHRAAKKAERDLKEAIARQSSAKILDEATEKELEEGREFRRRIEIEHDPVINEKYTKGQEALQTRAIAILQTHGLPPSTAQYIKESGGIFSFMSSNDLMPKDRVVGRDGKPLENVTHKQFFDDFIAPKLSPQDAKTIQALDLRATNLTLERDEELGKAKSNTADFFKNRQAELTKGREEWIGKVRSGALKQVAALGVKLLEVPAKATPAEKERIDKLNAEYKQAEGISQRALQSQDPEEIGKMAVVYAYHETKFKREMAEKDQSLEALRKRAEAAEQKLNAIKNAGKTPHSSAPVETAPKAKTTDQIKDPGERMAARMAETRK